MRVVAGSAKGRRLRAPKGEATRPTTDRVREAVANALFSADAVHGARVLDLFAGSGAVGIELLSRGAAHVTFVERDRDALEVLRDNLATTGLADRATVVALDVTRWLASPAGGTPVDVVVADPPYVFDAWPDLLAAVPAPLAVLESGRAPELAPGWEVVREKRYGTTLVTFIRRVAATSVE